MNKTQELGQREKRVISQFSEGPFLGSLCAGYHLTAFQLQSHLDVSPSEGRGGPETFRAAGTVLSFVPEGSGIHAGGRELIPGLVGGGAGPAARPASPHRPLPGGLAMDHFSMDSFPHTPEGRFPASSLQWTSSFCQSGTTVTPSPFSKT